MPRLRVITVFRYVVFRKKWIDFQLLNWKGFSIFTHTEFESMEQRSCCGSFQTHSKVQGMGLCLTQPMVGLSEWVLCFSPPIESSLAQPRLYLGQVSDLIFKEALGRALLFFLPHVKNQPPSSPSLSLSLSNLPPSLDLLQKLILNRT